MELYNEKVVIRGAVKGPYASGEAFGSNIGNALAQFGQTGGKISQQMYDEAEKEQQKNDVNAIIELESSLSDFNRQVLNGDEKKKIEGMFSRQGKNALGSMEEYESALENWKAEAEKSLKNQNQRVLFNNLYLRNRATHMDAVANHVAREKQRYYDENTEASVQSSLNDAVANYTDANLVNQAFNSGLAAIRVNYVGRGEILAEKVKNYKSEFYKLGVIRRNEDSPGAAKAYYEQHKKDIRGTEHITLEKMLREGSVNQYAMVKADELWLSGKSEKEQLAEAYNINDPYKRDATVNRIKARSADERRIESQEAGERLQDAYNNFNNVSSAVEAQMFIDKIANPAVKEQLRKEYDYKFGGKARETNWAVYYDLQQLASENIDKFKDINLLQYKAELGEPEFKELTKLQVNPTDKDVWQIRSRKQMIDQALAAVGIKDDAKKAQFYGVAERMSKTENADTPEKFQKLIDRMLMEGEVLTGAWYKPDPNRRMYEVDEEQRTNWVPDKIPAFEKKKIADALLRAGEKATEKRIEEIYAKKIKGSW